MREPQKKIEVIKREKYGTVSKNQQNVESVKYMTQVTRTRAEERG